MSMRKQGKLIAAILAAAGLTALAGCGAAKNDPKPDPTPIESNDTEPEEETDVYVEPVISDAPITHTAGYSEPLDDNQIWCAPMEMCWQKAMKVNGGPLEGKNSISVESLNNSAYNLDSIGQDHYYLYSEKVTDPAATCQQINNDLQEKFGEASEILNPDAVKKGKWAFYSMLYRKFSYGVPFDQLDNDSFITATGEVEHDISYFGFESGASPDMRSQVSVLYYDEDISHAVMLATQEGDRVVLVKYLDYTSPDKLYENAMKKAEKYNGSREISNKERLKIPNISFEATDEMRSLEGAKVEDGTDTTTISYAVQKTKLTMNNEGGEIKSEALLAQKSALELGNSDRPRYFDYNAEYALFLVDGNSPLNKEAFASGEYSKTMPYFAAKISNARFFQN